MSVTVERSYSWLGRAVNYAAQPFGHALSAATQEPLENLPSYIASGIKNVVLGYPPSHWIDMAEVKALLEHLSQTTDDASTDGASSLKSEDMHKAMEVASWALIRAGAPLHKVSQLWAAPWTTQTVSRALQNWETEQHRPINSWKSILLNLNADIQKLVDHTGSSMDAKEGSFLEKLLAPWLFSVLKKYANTCEDDTFRATFQQTSPADTSAIFKLWDEMYSHSERSATTVFFLNWPILSGPGALDKLRDNGRQLLVMDKSRTMPTIQDIQNEAKKAIHDIAIRWIYLFINNHLCNNQMPDCPNQTFSNCVDKPDPLEELRKVLAKNSAGHLSPMRAWWVCFLYKMVKFWLSPIYSAAITVLEKKLNKLNQVLTEDPHALAMAFVKKAKEVLHLASSGLIFAGLAKPHNPRSIRELIEQYLQTEATPFDPFDQAIQKVITTIKTSITDELQSSPSQTAVEKSCRWKQLMHEVQRPILWLARLVRSLLFDIVSRLVCQKLAKHVVALNQSSHSTTRFAVWGQQLLTLLLEAACKSLCRQLASENEPATNLDALLGHGRPVPRIDGARSSELVEQALMLASLIGENPGEYVHGHLREQARLRAKGINPQTTTFNPITPLLDKLTHHPEILSAIGKVCMSILDALALQTLPAADEMLKYIRSIVQNSQFWTPACNQEQENDTRRLNELRASQYFKAINIMTEALTVAGVLNCTHPTGLSKVSTELNKMVSQFATSLRAAISHHHTHAEFEKDLRQAITTLLNLRRKLEVTAQLPESAQGAFCGWSDELTKQIQNNLALENSMTKLHKKEEEAQKLTKLENILKKLESMSIQPDEPEYWKTSTMLLQCKTTLNELTTTSNLSDMIQQQIDLLAKHRAADWRSRSVFDGQEVILHKAEQADAYNSTMKTNYANCAHLLQEYIKKTREQNQCDQEQLQKNIITNFNEWLTGFETITPPKFLQALESPRLNQLIKISTEATVSAQMRKLGNATDYMMNQLPQQLCQIIVIVCARAL